MAIHIKGTDSINKIVCWYYIEEMHCTPWIFTPMLYIIETYMFYRFQGLKGKLNQNGTSIYPLLYYLRLRSAF